jgi:hypothetical protein
MPDNADNLTWRFPGIDSSNMSGSRKRTDSTHIARALYSLPCLASVPPPFQRNGSGALRQPPNTPRRQGGSASYALPDGGEKRYRTK